MSFLSAQFLCFMVAAWFLFVVCPANKRWLLLLVASYIFYVTWSIPFIGVILLSTSIDYFASRVVHKNESLSVKRVTLWLAIAANLFVLGAFKYFNFFVDAQAQICGMLGWQTPLSQHLNIILPLGISFYTFEAISYLVDTYRGAAPAPNWLSYNFYIMYFPHLISGPIVRFNELFPQYDRTIELPAASRILKGFELIVLGFLFKTVIANPCALVADPVFANAQAATPLTIYCASLAFAAQLYMDFLGYTHIARGVSLLFNIELPLNFDHPFHAPNISNHWQRWHITLSRWLHDYVYQPFGGTKKSLPLTMRNVFITFLICGIWHGAGWNYLIFGLYYGVVIGLYHAYRRWRNAVFKTKQRTIIENGFYKAAGHFVTFWLIVVGMVIFRAPNVATIGIFLSRLLNIPLLLQGVIAHVRTNDFVEIATCLLCLAVLVSGPKVVELYQQLFKPMPQWIKVQMASVAVVLCWIFCSTPIKQFIYFQF